MSGNFAPEKGVIVSMINVGTKETGKQWKEVYGGLQNGIPPDITVLP
jgi:hypothetical protein